VLATMDACNDDDHNKQCSGDSRAVKSKMAEAAKSCGLRVVQDAICCCTVRAKTRGRGKR
jgi:hypothetical protein